MYTITGVFKTTQPHRQNVWHESCNGLPSIKQKMYLDTFIISIQLLLKLLFIMTVIKIDLKTIFLNKTLKMLGLCLIDGSPLQLSRHDFCLWVAA